MSVRYSLCSGLGCWRRRPLSPPPPPAGRSSRSRSPQTRGTPSSAGCRAHRRATASPSAGGRYRLQATHSRWWSVGTARSGRPSTLRCPPRPAGRAGSRLCRALQAERASPSACRIATTQARVRLPSDGTARPGRWSAFLRLETRKRSTACRARRAPIAPPSAMGNRRSRRTGTALAGPLRAFISATRTEGQMRSPACPARRAAAPRSAGTTSACAEETSRTSTASPYLDCGPTGAGGCGAVQISSARTAATRPGGTP